jgi:ribonuclease HI
MTDPAAPEPPAASASSGRPAAAAASALPFVRLFTDGACSGNPGPGGWAYILQHPQSGKSKEVAGGAPRTTNNQMELQAVLEGLAALKARTRVEVVTDSTYVAKGCSEWLANWKRNGWRRREQGRWKPVANEDLWRRMDELLARHDVRFTVVRGHSGHPENERCDELAVAAAQSARNT